MVELLSLFLYLSLELQLDHSRPSSPAPRSLNAVTDAADTQLIQQYTAAQQLQQTALQQLPAVEDASQVPGWIHQLGVANRLAGLDKPWATGLVAAVGNDAVLGCIQESATRLLHGVRLGCSQGTPRCRLSRTAARILNTFDAGRTKTMLFKPVQEGSTLDSYAATWSGLLAFLVRLYQSKEAHAVRIREGFHPQEAIADSVGHIVDLAETLHAAEMEHSHLNSDSEQSSPSPNTSPRENPAIRRAQDTLNRAVSKCSIGLVRQLHGEQIYRSPVVEFCAFRAMTEAGNWVLAVAFTPSSAR